MSFQNEVFQPGAILHDVISGALRSRGTSLHKWYGERGVSVTTVRQITFGMSAGPRSQGLLNRLIDDAGRGVVTAAYRVRTDAEARKLAQGEKVAA